MTGATLGGGEKSTRLHRKFIHLLLLTATAVAALAATLVYEWSFRQATENGRAAIAGLVNAMQKTAAVGVYANDSVLLQEIVDGIARHPLVAHVRVDNAQGAALVYDRRAVKGLSAEAGAAGPTVFAVEVPLSSPFDSTEMMGVLRVQADSQRLRADARSQALVIGGAMAALTAVLAMVLNVVALRLLSRPMTELAKQINRKEPGTSERLRLPARHADDEIGIVLAAANRLLDATEAALGREREMRAEIAAMEAQYRQIFDFTSAGIFVLTPGGRLINGNPTVSRVIGGTVAQMSQLRGTDFINLVFIDPLRVREMIDGALTDGETVSADLELRRLDGGTRWVHCLISVQQGAGNAGVEAATEERLVEGVIYDVTQRKRAESVAVFKAEHDALTGLKNRAAIESALEQMIARSRTGRLPVTVLFIDLDGFKQVNDHFGHQAGDKVLVECATRLRGLARRSGDLVGRLGGDELVMVLDGVTADEGLAQDLARRVVAELAQPVALTGGRVARVGASVGVASWPQHARTASGLLRAADASMYEVKQEGKNGFRVACSFAATQV